MYKNNIIYTTIYIYTYIYTHNYVHIYNYTKTTFTIYGKRKKSIRL